MINLEGKYGEAKIAANYVESSAIAQIQQLLNSPVAENAHIRIMPDVHAGKGCVIGTSMYVTDKIVPNLVGVDIGCGVYSVNFTSNNLNLEKIDNIIHNKVPHGFKIHDESVINKYPNCSVVSHDIDNIINSIKAPINKERAILSIGSLGGGNHFIEIDNSNKNEYYMNIHSGSRHLGVEVASYYQKKAQEYCESKGYKIPKDLAFLEGNDFYDYMHDMQLVQKYAEENRAMIFEIIYYHMIKSDIDISIYDNFSTVHNYIENNPVYGYILRKGAVSAYKNQKIMIPINMKDGVLLCKGKENEEWNFTAPHGAGRLYSRGAAKSELSMEKFKEDMKDIYTTCVKESTLDECPSAYKDINTIIEHIEPMATIIETLTPIYNFKA